MRLFCCAWFCYRFVVSFGPLGGWKNSSWWSFSGRFLTLLSQCWAGSSPPQTRGSDLGARSCFAVLRVISIAVKGEDSPLTVSGCQRCLVLGASSGNRRLRCKVAGRGMISPALWFELRFPPVVARAASNFKISLWDKVEVRALDVYRHCVGKSALTWKKGKTLMAPSPVWVKQE